MSILTLFVVIPALMLLGLWLAKSLNQVRGVMVAGASCLLALSVWLTIYFVQQRAAGNTDVMLLTYSTPWFKPLNIAYSVGVDGISVVMLLLSSIIVFTGTFASWQLKPLTKEYFLWFTLLSTGVYGFFICTDMFTMFMFYEVALIPMYLLIGVWGSGNKEYAAMKLTLMLMGWCYHHERQRDSCYAQYPRRHPEDVLPLHLHRFRCAGRAVPLPHMVT